MKLVRFLIYIALIVFISVPVFAEDSDTDWNTMMNNADTAGFNKPVTQKQFDDALNTVQNRLHKKPKASKTTKDSKDINNEVKGVINKEDFAALQDDLILRLVNSGYYEESLIPCGFYRLKPTLEGSQSYIEFMQGGKSIAKIKAARVKPLFCPDNVKCIKAELFEDKYLKIFYKDLNVALIGYIYVLKN